MEFRSQEFADFVGISKKTVQNYRDEGMPSVKNNSYYFFNFEAIQWLYDNGKKDVLGTGSQESEEQTPKYRKDLADAKLKEHALAEKEEKYILKVEIEEELVQVAKIFRDSFQNLSNISPLLVGKNQHEMKAIIDKKTYKMLEDFSNSATL